MNKNASEAVNWKLWKAEKKLLQRKWKEQKIMKQLEKQKKKEKAEISELKSNKTAGRHYTVSIALPGSILDNAQTKELQVYLAGQISRAASIFNIDEIVIFDETGSLTKVEETSETLMLDDRGYTNIQLSHILQYLECPQYLRKDLIPLHSDLKFVGLLNPLDTPHHLRATDKSFYREGIVTKKPVKEGKGSFVKVGLEKEVQIDKTLEAGTRVTVFFDPEQDGKHLKGKVVSPSAPRLEAGIYWGYSVRIAVSLSAAIAESSFKEGYDLIVGTSDNGDNVDDVDLPVFKHMLIVFGGLGGLEASVEADEALLIDDPRSLFHLYLNTCPNQGSRTIRTEEAILISLSVLRPKVLKCQF